LGTPWRSVDHLGLWRTGDALQEGALRGVQPANDGAQPATAGAKNNVDRVALMERQLCGSALSVVSVPIPYLSIFTKEKEMMRFVLLLFWIFFSTAVLINVVNADEVILENGAKLTGKVAR